MPKMEERTLMLGPPVSPGMLRFVHCLGGRGDVWHERLLLCQTSERSWVVMTPDRDIYEEDVSELLFVPSAPEREPRRLAGKLLYRFPALDEMHTKADLG